MAGNRINFDQSEINRIKQKAYSGRKITSEEESEWSSYILLQALTIAREANAITGEIKTTQTKARTLLEEMNDNLLTSENRTQANLDILSTKLNEITGLISKVNENPFYHLMLDLTSYKKDLNFISSDDIVHLKVNDLMNNLTAKTALILENQEFFKRELEACKPRMNTIRASVKSAQTHNASVTSPGTLFAAPEKKVQFVEEPKPSTPKSKGRKGGCTIL